MIRRPGSSLGRQTSVTAEAPWRRRDRSSASGRPMQPAGELFLPPDVDQTRRFFSEKSQALIDKRMTVSEAVSRFIHDGDYIASGGFGASGLYLCRITARTPSSSFDKALSIGSMLPGKHSLQTCDLFSGVFSNEARKSSIISEHRS